MIQPSEKSNLVSYPIRDIVLEAKALERKGTKMIYLNIGDPAPFGFRPPKHILDAATDAMNHNYSGYAPSEGDPELRQEAAKYEGVDSGDVFISSGLSEGIEFLYTAMVNPGDNILLPVPAYPLYITKQKLYGGAPVFCKSDENFIPDMDDMLKSITPSTKAILVINPNNPTGMIYPRKILEEIVNLAGEFNLPLIGDDAYEKIVLDGEYTNLRKIHKDVPLVSGNSLSKNYIYPGARVGYIAFHGQGWDKIKDAIQRLCNQRLSVNWEMQRAYIAALRGSDDHITVFNKELRKRRDVLVKRVSEIDGLSVPMPKGAFYALIKVEKQAWKSDWDFVRELLKEGVVAVPGSGFGPLDGLYFRVAYFPGEEQLNDAFSKIENVLKRH